MKISLVAALARNGVIGSGGKLPWHLPEDLRFFKRLTTGHCIAMGRKTFDSVGRPLPERTNLVISRNATLEVPGVVVVRSLEAAVEAARERGESELFVVGGGDIYALALPRADRLYLTRVDVEPPGDAHFPRFDEAAWVLRSEAAHAADARHSYAIRFQVWDRRDAVTQTGEAT